MGDLDWAERSHGNDEVVFLRRYLNRTEVSDEFKRLLRYVSRVVALNVRSGQILRLKLLRSERSLR